MGSDALPRLKRRGDAPKVGIVHFGPGAFFRAFNAVYTDEAMAAAGGDWGIVAVSLKSTTARDQLLPQGGVYTSVSLGTDGETAKPVGSVVDVLVAPEDPEAVIDLLANPNVKIASLTITEKGYGYDSATGGLDRAQSDIAADLANPNFPKSAVGFVIAALKVRRQAGVPPFTVLSCDNLPSNGAVTRAVVLEYAREVVPELMRWIEETVSFPSTMVDRITPATTDADLARLADQTGFVDQAAVFHEPFRQWVIEDRFPTGRPAWDSAGAQFVQSVEAHETMKLRCLNGTHSALAYLGYLAGYETIADTVADPVLAAFCERLWAEEIIPTVPPPEGEDLAAYTNALMTRYRNPSIRHRTWQIAMDGSQKLPQRILGTIHDHLAEGRVPRGLCLVVAAWMRYVGGVDEADDAIDVRDPLAERLRAASDSAETPGDRVSALLAVNEVFGSDLPKSAEFVGAVSAAYERLCSDGSAATVLHHLQCDPAG